MVKVKSIIAPSNIANFLYFSCISIILLPFKYSWYSQFASFRVNTTLNTFVWVAANVLASYSWHLLYTSRNKYSIGHCVYFVMRSIQVSSRNSTIISKFTNKLVNVMFSFWSSVIYLDAPTHISSYKISCLIWNISAYEISCLQFVALVYKQMIICATEIFGNFRKSLTEREFKLKENF